MRWTFRSLIFIAAAIAFWIAGMVSAQPYPSRPIRVVIPFPGGGGPMNLAGRILFLLMVHPSVPVKSAAELVAHARAQPGKLAYGSGNVTAQVMMAQFALANKLDMVHVPYGPGPHWWRPRKHPKPWLHA